MGAWWFAVALVVALGCNPNSPCDTASDCPGSQYCRGTFCTRYPAGDTCERNGQCITRSCIAGRCTGELGVLCLDSRASSCPIDGVCSERPGILVSPVCMLRCDRATDWECGDGTVCLRDSDDETRDVCFLGGGSDVGESCAFHFHCGAGQVCQDRRCRAACDTTRGNCPTGQTCTPIDHPSGVAGGCLPSE